MKKALIIVCLAIVSAAVGGVTASLIMNRAAHRPESEERVEQQQGQAIAPITGMQAAGTHFTAFTQGEYPDLTYAAENAVQAVVNIEVTQVINVRRLVDPILQFFGYSQPETAPRERKVGGSGVIISPDGYITTNSHVVENAKELKVKLYDGRTFDAEVTGSDPTTDIALIKIEGTDLPSLPMGNSDELRLGEWVLAIGSPFDLNSTITAGIVSAKARSLGAGGDAYSVESFIQTDAAVNPGNSGGALVNTRGELVGINTLIKSPTGTYSGYSFAVPVSIVGKVVADIKEYGIVQRAMLGVAYIPVDDDFVEAFGEEYGITESGGLYVGNVDPVGAAHAAGIKEGDVIIAVDGIQLGNSANLAEIMSKYRPSDKINISVKRAGEVKHFDLTLRNKDGGKELLPKNSAEADNSLKS
jgi:S1-C subfamily serine protease